MSAKPEMLAGVKSKRANGARSYVKRATVRYRRRADKRALAHGAECTGLRITQGWAD